MAGRRRNSAAADGAELPPTLRRSRLDRRRAELTTRYASATTDIERLRCAFDYFRGAASRRQPRPEHAAELVAATTDRLIEAGDQLLRMQGKEPLRPTRKDAV